MVSNILTAFEFFITGEWLSALKQRLIPPISTWGNLKECLEYLSKTLKDAKNFGFIGEEAENRLSQLDRKYRYDNNAYVDSQDLGKLTLAISRWEGRLQETSKGWILSYPDTHIDASNLLQGPKAFLSNEEFSIL